MCPDRLRPPGGNAEMLELVGDEEPAWETLPGLGVHFRELSPDDRARIEARLRQAAAKPR